MERWAKYRSLAFLLGSLFARLAAFRTSQVLFKSFFFSSFNFLRSLHINQSHWMHSPRKNLQLCLKKKKNQYYLSVAFKSPFQILELFNKNPAVRIGSICLLFLEIQNIVPEFLRKNGMIYCVSVLLQSVVTTVFMCSDLNSWGIFSSLTLCINCTSLSDINNKKPQCFFLSLWR